MASVIQAIDIGTSADECWRALKDFGALHERLASGFVTNCRLIEPDVREVTFSSGAVAKERLVAIDDKAMRLAYTVIDSPLGSTHYNASAQVISNGPTSCQFLWTIDVLPHELAAPIAALVDDGIRTIKHTLETHTG